MCDSGDLQCPAALNHLCYEYAAFGDIEKVEMAPGRPPNRYFYVRTRRECEDPGRMATDVVYQDYFVRSGEDDADLRLRHELFPRVAERLSAYNDDLRRGAANRETNGRVVFVAVPEPVAPTRTALLDSDDASVGAILGMPRVKSSNGLRTCAGCAAFSAALRSCSRLLSDDSPGVAGDERVEVPGWVSRHKNHWDEADDIDYLVDHVHPKLSKFSLLLETGQGVAVADRALTLLAEHREAYALLPKQLTHGDMGLGNVMISVSDADSKPRKATACIIDFTPYATESHLYAFTVTLYWTFLYGPLCSCIGESPSLDEARMRSSVAAYLSTAASFDLPDLRHMWYIMFVKVACRMLFVPVLWAEADVAFPSFVSADAVEKYVRVLDWVMRNQALLENILDVDVNALFCEIRPSGPERGRMAKECSIDEGAFGAIVVPASLSSSLREALGRWCRERQPLTLYEPEPAPEEAHHALHLSKDGAAILKSLTAPLGPFDEADLHTCLSTSWVEAQVDSDVVELLEALLRVCTELQQELGCCPVRWLPHLRPSSLPCCRRWRGASIQAWRRRAAASPLPRFTFCELFAGIGGFRLGLEAVGGRCVFASEIKTAARRTYMRNFPSDEGAAPLGDVRSISADDLPAFDLLAAGFPCQSYTCYNPDSAGLDCAKGELVWEVLRLLRCCRPAAVLLENVQGLVNHRSGNDLAQIVAQLRGAGYAVGWRSLDARRCVPQKRLRVYIVCIRQDLKDYYVARQSSVPSPEDAGVVRFGGESKALGDSVIDWAKFEAAAAEQKPKTFHEVLQPQASADTFLTAAQWDKAAARSVVEEEGSEELARRKRLLTSDADWAGALRSTYRCDWRRASQFVASETLPRFFTTRECARLMGFPETYEIDSGNGFYKQIGNAVVPELISQLALGVLQTIMR
ncbi:dsaVM [Symbiodinium necroappetens]|uniref:tRNA (cytosine(38)-C(5))-methyltransferase n=1 Tax=Symbiodinium necroappetens TaxID=1628268 RepID=A0A812ZDE0_9DINO|nr:dsaVM [Symbiodinium necroappetens]